MLNTEFDSKGLNIKKGSLAQLSLLNLKPFVFEDLPISPDPATIAYITDGDTNVIGDVVAGSGANTVIIIYGATDWTVLAVLT